LPSFFGKRQKPAYSSASAKIESSTAYTAMQRAARLLSKIKLQSARLAPEEFAEAVWPAAVGKRLALRTGPVKLYGRALVVDVEDAQWQKQLTTMSAQILTKVQMLAGPGMVDSIEFRIGIPRREPRVALPFVDTDDRADGINDPIFRQLYLASRAQCERDEEKRMRISA
jgi:predicted nucleic acid-binding Zn ribbon protein